MNLYDRTTAPPTSAHGKAPLTAPSPGRNATVASQTDTDPAVTQFLAEHADTDWYAGLLFPDGTSVVGSNLTELASHLVSDYQPGQALSDAVDAYEARCAFAAAQANMRQGMFAFVASEQGDFDPEQATEDELTALFADRATVIPAIASWDRDDFPLVLVATDHYPHSDIPVPAGNVEVIDPTTERSLLQSLADLGDFRLIYR